MINENPHSWWQTGVIYQVYPRSFFDSNGDGVGDLPGITSNLDYLRWLGVDALWLSPIYPSPMADFGYDISNYTDVHPLFGSLEDLDTLLHQAHRHDIKLILDFVPNHTSDAQHSRDPQRTPMQWHSGPNAGFCPPNVKPWLPVAGDYQTYNVAVEQQDPRSFLTLVHTLLTLRRTLPALTVGAQQSIDQPNPTCFVYLCQHQDQCCLVVLNFSVQDQVVTLPGQGQGRLLLSTYLDREGPIALSEVHLRGNEGLLMEV